MKRVIQREIENELARGILRGDIGEEDTVTVDTEIVGSGDHGIPSTRFKFAVEHGSTAKKADESPVAVV